MSDKLVLVPGFANDELAWDYQINALTSLCDIHVFIMNQEKSREEMVKSLLGEAPSQFILAGHSMGGWVAQAVAAMAPERVQKLILINTWATPDHQMISMQRQICETLKLGKLTEVMQKHFSSLLHPSRIQDPSLIQQLQKMVMNFPTAVLIQQLEAMLADYSSLQHHPSISAPTLIIHSSNDALFPKEHEVLQQGIKNSQLAFIEECGHASTVEKPEIVTQLMRSFIENI